MSALPTLHREDLGNLFVFDENGAANAATVARINKWFHSRLAPPADLTADELGALASQNGYGFLCSGARAFKEGARACQELLGARYQSAPSAMEVPRGFAGVGRVTWWRASEKLPPPETEVLVVCRNKNKEDGIPLFDMTTHDGEAWRQGVHTWEDVVLWAEITVPERF